MRIVIVTTEDPLYTIPFLKEVISARSKDIVGIALVRKGGRLSVRKKDSKILYIITLLIILGPFLFIEDVFRTLSYRMKKKFSLIVPFINNPSILSFANNLGIKNFVIDSPNSKDFLEKLAELKPDIIINQSQSILKDAFLKIPKYGVLNRHNALLPKNRGRLTPFWVKFKKESKTGVSIHFVEREIDSGAIVVQKSFTVKPNDTISSIVKRNYEIAPIAMLEALVKIEQGDYITIDNDNSRATYNTIPKLKDAINFRLGKKYYD